MSKRYHTEDVVPEDAEDDADFKKLVRQVEDQHHGRGAYVLSQGALDKGDLAYQKEQEERRRHAEEARELLERTEFAAARARAEAEERERAMNMAMGKRENETIGDRKKQKVAPSVAVVKPAHKANTKNAASPPPPTKLDDADADEDEAKDGGLIADLLCGYGSDDDTTEDPHPIPPPPPNTKPKSKLPSAAHLL